VIAVGPVGLVAAGAIPSLVDGPSTGGVSSPGSGLAVSTIFGRAVLGVAGYTHADAVLVFNGLAVISTPADLSTWPPRLVEG